MGTRTRAWRALMLAGFLWAISAQLEPTFVAPNATDPRNSPSLSTAYKTVTNYLSALITLSSATKHYDVFIRGDGVTYDARQGDVGDLIDHDTSIGALLNRLYVGGGVTVQLKTLGTYNSIDPIVIPANNCVLLGRGPGTVIKAAASAHWTTGSSHQAGNYMFDCFNGGAGRKWVGVQDVWFDCNNIAEGGVRYCGLVSDTTQWNLFYRSFVSNFRVVGVTVEDQSTAGGTRQHVDFNKIGPGTSGVPTRGMDIRCNDIHPLDNDIFGVSDVGIYISKRGAAQDKGTGSWFISGGHIAVGNYQSGGLSPDTQPVNVLVDATASSGEINRVYLDNVKRYAIYLKPAGGHQMTLAVRNCWFNGLTSLADAAGSDKAVALVLDESASAEGQIYAIEFSGNRANTAKTGSNTTAGVWYAMVALLGGMLPGDNYVSMDHNRFRGCLHFWDPNGARPDYVGPDNWRQPQANNTSSGIYAWTRGLWTTLQNLLANPNLTTDFNADNIPDLWTKQSTVSSSYVSGVWQIVCSNINQLILQNVPCIAGKAYSVSFDASVIAGTGGAKLAILFLDETGTQVGAGASASGPTGVGGFSNLAVNNKTAPVDDGHSGGTVDTTSGTAAIVAKTGTFPNDLVNPFVIAGAGVGGADLVTTIATYTDSTHVTLTTAPSATITDAIWTAYGHGDAVAFQVSLKGVTPTVTIQWKNGIVAQGANTAGQSGANAVGTVNTTAGTAAIVAATGTFPNDLVRPIVIAGAGPNGSDLVTRIATFTDGTHVTLAVAPSTSVTAAVWCMAWYIPHGLGDIPSYFTVAPANGVAGNAMGDTAFGLYADATNVIAATKSCTAPRFMWEARL